MAVDAAEHGRVGGTAAAGNDRLWLEETCLPVLLMRGRVGVGPLPLGDEFPDTKVGFCWHGDYMGRFSLFRCYANSLLLEKSWKVGSRSLRRRHEAKHSL